MSTRTATRTKRKLSRPVPTRARKSTVREQKCRSESATRLRRFAAAGSEGVAFLRNGVIEDCNDQLARMVGCRRKELLNRPFLDCVTTLDRPRLAAQLEYQGHGRCECQVLREDGSAFAIEVQTRVAARGRVRTQIATVRDLSERNQAEHVLRVRLRLQEFAAGHSLEETLQKALDEAEELTGSQVGFYHFVESDEKALSLQAWSTRTQAVFCKAEGQGLHYAIDQAGVWTDCVRERRAIIHNDYAALPHRKGLPEGHAALTRELLVPVFREGRIVAILGVGNKPLPYTEQDVALATFVADLAWAIAARKGSETELQMTHAGLEAIGIGLLRTGPDAQILGVNAATCRMLGHTAEELRQLTVFDIDPTFTPERWQTHRESVPATLTRSFESTHRRKDGSTFPVEITSSYHTEHGGLYALSFVRDITKRQRAEAAVLASERRERARADELSTLLEASRSLTSSLALDAVFQAITDGAARLTGMSSAAVYLLEGQTLVLHAATPPLPPEFPETFHQAPLHDHPHIREALATGHPVLVPDMKAVELGAAEGQIREMRDLRTILYLPLHFRSGRQGTLIVGSVGEPCELQSGQVDLCQSLANQATIALENAELFRQAQQEIAERKRAEAALRESEERFRTLFETMAQGVVYQDASGAIIEANPAAQRILGLTLEQMRSRTSLDPQWKAIREDGSDFPGEDHPAMVALRTHQYVQNVVMGVYHSRLNRHTWINIHAVPQFKSGATAPHQVYAVFEDITERKRAEQALRESEHRLRAVMDNAQAIIFMLDARGVFRLSEGLGLARLGLAPGQVVGQSALELYKDHPSVTEGIQAALSGRTVRTTNVLGDLVFDSVYSPYLTAEGKPDGVVGIAIDITDRARAEALARESEERLGLALQGADLGSWDWNLQTGEVRVNERWAEMLGYRVEEIEPRVESWETRVHPDDLPGVRQALQAHLEGRASFYETEHRMRHKSGHWVWVLDRGKVIERDAGGTPLRAVGTHLDISERKRAERALRESEGKLSSILRVAPTGIGVVSNRVFKEVNERICTMTGYSRAELVEQNSRMLYPSDEEYAFVGTEKYGQIKASGTGTVETRWKRKDGTLLEVLLSSSPINQDDWSEGVTFTALDITERKRAEAELLTSRQMLRTVLDTIPTRVFWKDKRSVYVGCNRALALDCGYDDPGQLIGKTDFDTTSASTAERYQADDRRVMETREAKLGYEEPQLRSDGSQGWLRTNKVPLLDPKGNVIGVLGTYEDITDRRRIEEALRESEQRFRQMFEHSRAVMLLLDPDSGAIAEANPAAAEFYGYPREVLRRMNIETINQLSPDQVKAARRAASAGQAEVFEFPHRLASGEQRIVAVRSSPVSVGGQPLLFSIIQDITERKRAEEALRLSEEKFRALVESTNDFIWEVDAEGHYTYVSPRIQKLLGYEPSEMLGQTPFDLMPPVEGERLRAIYLDHVATRRPLNNLMNMNRHKDGSLVFLETSGTPILDAAGQLVGYRGIDRDITERKEAEQERERLIRELEAKNAELERFTYTVSHDLKSPLITIKGFAGALLHDVSAGRQDRVEDDLKRIASATDKMAELLNDLLELSRIGRMMNPPSDVDLDILLRDVVELLAGPVSQQKVELTIQPGLPRIRGDRRRMAEVFQNLIENAIHFMGSQPRPHIEIGLRDADTKPVFFVRDNGVGIEPRYHETIFGLFNKLDSKTAGTGIGLALVRRIIEVHGGRVWVESEGQGRGATFCFTLPVVNPDPKEPQP